MQLTSHVTVPIVFGVVVVKSKDAIGALTIAASWYLAVRTAK